MSDQNQQKILNTRFNAIRGREEAHQKPTPFLPDYPHYSISSFKSQPQTYLGLWKTFNSYHIQIPARL